jgi:hypothetical protein
MPNQLRPRKTKLLPSSDKTFSTPTEERCICTKVPAIPDAVVLRGSFRISSPFVTSISSSTASPSITNRAVPISERGLNDQRIAIAPVVPVIAAVFLLGKGLSILTNERGRQLRRP